MNRPQTEGRKIYTIFTKAQKTSTISVKLLAAITIVGSPGGYSTAALIYDFLRRRFIRIHCCTQDSQIIKRAANMYL